MYVIYVYIWQLCICACVYRYREKERCTHEYYSGTKEGILPFVTTWMDFEDIMLSERSQTKKDKYCVFSHTCGISKPSNAQILQIGSCQRQSLGVRKWVKIVKSTNFQF